MQSLKVFLIVYDLSEEDILFNYPFPEGDGPLKFFKALPPELADIIQDELEEEGRSRIPPKSPYPFGKCVWGWRQADENEINDWADWRLSLDDSDNFDESDSTESTDWEEV